MASYSKRTYDIDIPLLILPGFQEGLSCRGAWFAWMNDAADSIRKFSHKRQHVIRYTVYEPSSPFPLSDAELTHVLNYYTMSLDMYRSTLEALELSYKETRKQGKINALLYILGILTIKWYWWIFITRGESSFYNKQNALKAEYASQTGKFIARFWIRGKEPVMREVLDEITEQYVKLRGEPLYKYMMLRTHAGNRADYARKSGDHKRWNAYQLVEEGYRAIIKKLTDQSPLVKLFPSTFWQRIIHFFMGNIKVPVPESLWAVRNLKKELCTLDKKQTLHTSKAGKTIMGVNRVRGNILELYLLHTKKKDPICVVSESVYRAFQARAETIQEKDIPLEILLHVGSVGERNSLLGFYTERETSFLRRQSLQKRLQNAALDVGFQGEAIYGYKNREIISVITRRYRMMYPFRSRLHSLFPWLFIMHGIPMAAALAAVWFFVDPYYSEKIKKKYIRHFSRIIDGARLAYHNVVVRVMCNPALGHINEKIRRDSGGKAYRGIMREIGECALPLALFDRASLNNLTLETTQLTDFQREANSFTSIPLSFLRSDTAGKTGNTGPEIVSTADVLDRKRMT
jgi:hypothetical protein